MKPAAPVTKICMADKIGGCLEQYIQVLLWEISRVKAAETASQLM